MTIYIAHYGKNQLTAYTDYLGFWRVASKSLNNITLKFSSFDDLKKKFKSFSKIGDYSLIDYDLPFSEFMAQFENGKESDDLEKDIKTWREVREWHTEKMANEARIIEKLKIINNLI